MFGTAQPIPQRLDLRAFALTTAIGGVVLAATIALAAASGAINGSKPVVTVPAAPALVMFPVDRDLGSGDTGAAVRIGITPYGAPGAYRPVSTSGGSSTLVKDDVAIKTRAAQGFLPGFLADPKQHGTQTTPGSGQAAPAGRPAGLWAQ